MKLNLKVLKNVMIIKCEDNDIDCIEVNEWIKNNIGEGEVSVRDWLDEVRKYWIECSDDYGDSDFIVDVLENDYKLSEDEVDKIMSIYWDCDSVEEYREDYK